MKVFQFLLLFIFGLFTFSAQAQWTGAVNSDWNNAGNWVGGNIPSSVDFVFIDPSTRNPVISTSVTLYGIQINPGAGLTINSSGKLSLRNFDPRLAILDNRGSVTNNGEINIISFASEDYAILNEGTFVNEAPTNGSGGVININDISGRGINNISGYTFENLGGTITLETEEDAILNDGTFLNETTDQGTATINIEAGGDDGIVTSGAFTNRDGVINIGQVSFGIVGIGIVVSDGSFFNLKQFINGSPTISIDGTGGDGIEVLEDATFLNNNGTITLGQNNIINGNGIENFGTFTNVATIHIKSTKFDGVGNRNNSATFKNQSGAVLNIGISGGAIGRAGLVNLTGTFTNNGSTIKIGNTGKLNATEGWGLLNHQSGTFNNNNGALLEIGQSGQSIADLGLANITSAKFNNANSTIKIDNTGNAAMICQSLATFDNKNSATLDIGQNQGNITTRGISTGGGGSIINNSSIIRIDETTEHGLSVAGTDTFDNLDNAQLLIGQKSGNIGQSGLFIFNDGVFTNNGSTTKIDNTANDGILMQAGADFINEGGGKIYIGENGTIGNENKAAIALTGVAGNFSNTGCSEIHLYDFINLANTPFNNEGFLFIDADQAHTNNSTLTNNGVINYVQDNLIPNVTNNDLIIAPLSSTSCAFADVLQKGASNNFDAAATWYTNAGMSNAGGIYTTANNTFVPSNLQVGSDDFYFQVSGNGCTFDAFIELTFDNTSTTTTRTWNGFFGTDWTEDCNWTPSGVPQSTDDVVIPNTTNKPVIDGTTSASVKSVKIKGEASLTIHSGGTLNVDDSSGDGISNSGTVNNSGTIQIGASSAPGQDGILNEGTITNNGTIDVKGAAGNGFYNFGNGKLDNKSGSSLLIGTISATGSIALRNVQGEIFNRGTISLIRTDANGIANNGSRASISNLEGATLNIGTPNGSVGNRGILNNNGRIINNASTITIENTGKVNANQGNGIKNQAGATFNNINGATLAIGQNGNDVQNYGLINSTGASFQNSGSTVEIDNVTKVNSTGGDALLIEDGSFNNKDGGVINIGQNGGSGSIGDNGIHTKEGGLFKNNGGVINIDNILGNGFLLDNSEVLENSGNGQINIGQTGTIGGTGVDLQNAGAKLVNDNGTIKIDATDAAIEVEGSGASMTNTDCSEMYLYSNLQMGDTPFTNEGFLFIDTDQTHTNNVTFTNNGVINYLQDNPIPGVTNNDLIIAPITLDCNLADAIQIGGDNSFTVLSEWFNDSGLSDKAGSYNQTINLFIPTNLEAGTNTLHFTVNDGTCIYNTSIEVTSAMAITSTNCTWNGSVSTDWNDACNWTPFFVPTAEDDVVIPATANDPVISGGINAVAKSVKVETGATLTVESNNELAIDDSSDDALYNEGTLTVNGTLNIGQTDGVGGNGMVNDQGEITNNGTVNIDNTSSDAIYNTSIFNNSGILNIGQINQTNSIGNRAIRNNDTFTNEAGEINIDRILTNRKAILNSSGTFTNKAIIHIGANTEAGIRGIENNASFNNDAGEINIDRTSESGIQNKGTFTNKATINIGANASVGRYGIEIRINGSFINEAGEINIDRATFDGLSMPSGIFRNRANINIGCNSNTISTGLYCDGSFFNESGEIIIKNTTSKALEITFGSRINNEACASIRLFDNMIVEYVKNDGFFSVDAADDSEVFSFENNGILEDVQGTVPTDVAGFVNNEIIISPTLNSDCGDISPAFDLAAMIDFDIVGIFIDENATISAGAYDELSNTFIPKNTLPSGSYILYVMINDPVNGCVSIAEWTTEIVAGIVVWTGANSSDWNDAGNWSSNVPQICNDVVIPGTANAPIISGGITAVAKSVTVDPGAGLTIEANNELSIDGSSGNALFNDEFIQNNGTINIGQTIGVGTNGIYNGGDIRNDGTINIDNTGANGYYDSNSSDFFKNSGHLNIGQNGGAGNIGNIGIWVNQGDFENDANGQIAIDRTVSHGVRSGEQGDFDNYGIVETGQNGGVGSIGEIGFSIENGSLDNFAGASLIIDNTVGIGLQIADNGGMANFGFIAVGKNGGGNSIGGIGLDLSGTFSYVNESCATTYIATRIEIPLGRTIDNKGHFIVNTSDSHTNAGTFNNNGILEYSQSSFIPNVVNNEIIIAPASGSTCDPLTPAFDLGATVDFNILGVFTDENATVSAGIFDQANNSLTLASAFTSGTYTFFVKIQDPVNGCESILEWTVDISTSNVTWTGNNSTDWDDAGNWDIRVPAACDNVFIPNVANDPIIGAGTLAVANSVTIETNGHLTILTGGHLETFGASGGDPATFNDSYGILALGTLENSGNIIVGATNGNPFLGIAVREATLNNHASGSITIDDVIFAGLWLWIADFNNYGLAEIGLNSSIAMSGSFINTVQTCNVNNYEGASIKLANCSSVAINLNTEGVFYNEGMVHINQNGVPLSPCTVGFGFRETLTNTSTGEIKMDHLTGTAINIIDNNGTLINAGQIDIGQNSPPQSISMGITLGVLQVSNLTGGVINIDNVSNTCISSPNDGSLTNHGTINIGQTGGAGSLGERGINWNSDGLLNNMGIINIDHTTKEALVCVEGTIENRGIINIGRLGNIGAAEAIEVGISSASLINFECALINVASDNIILNFFGNFLINHGIIIENSSGESEIFENNGIVQNLNGGNFIITNNNGSVITQENVFIWTGCQSTDWTDAGNWLDQMVPTITDDVIIPNVTNDPDIMDGTLAVAKSVIVETGAILDIATNGSLEVNGSTNYGLENNGSVNNDGGIEINNTFGAALRINAGGTFTNRSMIGIGNTMNIGGAGISNAGTLNNDAGEINVYSAGTTGILNTQLFNNLATINIGTNGSVGLYGIDSRVTFNNDSGEINIDNASEGGIYAEGNFTNRAAINIGVNASTGKHGIENFSIFRNLGGVLNINNASVGGIVSYGNFSNKATINIGEIASVGIYGVANNSVFNNNSCALLNIVSDNVIEEAGNFTNNGIIIENATGDSEISGNFGIIQNLNGGNFFIAGGSGSIITAAGTIWTGCEDTDWSTPGNWYLGTVPTATDDAIIPDVANDPSIIGNTDAVAKSVSINSGAHLNIASSSSLTIDDSEGDGMTNYGTVSNFGLLNVGLISGITKSGIVNHNVFDNNTGGTISIDNALFSGILNQSGTFTNFASISVNANDYGIENRAVFINEAGEIVASANSDSGIYNDGGNFTNKASIKIVENDGSTGQGIENDGTFTNESGSIDIDIKGSADIRISSGTIINKALINIGQGVHASEIGIDNTGSFINESGTVNIDKTSSDAFFNNGGVFINKAAFNIGSNTSIGRGIRNEQGFIFNQNGGELTISNTTNAVINEPDGEFNNKSCSVVRINGGIVNNQEIMFNEGLFRIDAANTSTPGNFTNSGIIEDVQGTFPINGTLFVNNEIVVAPAIGDCAEVDPAFSLGAAVDFNILGIFTDQNATQSAGTFDLNTNTFTSNTGLGQSDLFVQIEDPVNGCTRIVSWSIENIDNIPPTPVCVNSIVELDVNGSYGLQQSDVFTGGDDNCTIVNFISMSPSSVDCDNNGSIVQVTVTAMDASGNQATCIANVTVEDNAAPTPVCLNPIVSLDANGNHTLSENEVFDYGTDNCSSVTFISMYPNVVDCNNVTGPVSVTVTAQDASGNQNTCTATVTVTENVAPVATCQDLTIELDSNGNVPIAASQVDNGSSDNCGIDTQVLDVTSFGCANVGANTVTLTVTDINGNSTDCTATVNIEDNEAPLAQCKITPIAVTLNASGEYTVDPADLDDSSNDACGIQSLAASPTLLDCSNEGANIITLSVTDVNGNTSTCTATVEVATFFSIDNITENDETCTGMGNGSIVIEATTGGGQIGYSIDGGSNFQFGNTFNSLTPGTYNVVVKIFGINGACEKTATATVGSGSQLQIWYSDQDGDHYSDGITMTSCSQPAGYYPAGELLATSGDCNDNDANEFPGQAWYEDLDGDGHSSGNTLTACQRPTGCYTAAELAATSGDCDDSEATVHPGATEACNGIDDDCDGEVDEGTSGGLTFTGNVTFYTQASVDAFSQCYSIIDGNVTFLGTNISDLSNLFNIEEITGSLTIQTTGLTSMNGLDNLVEVGGTLTIYFNSSLTTLDGLNVLGAVGGNLSVYYNFTLNDACAIYNLINGGVSGSMSIFLNATGANSVAEINANCGSSNLAAGPDNGTASTSVQQSFARDEKPEHLGTKVFPNPAVGQAVLAFDKPFNSGKIQVSDLTGKLVFEQQIVENTYQITLDLNGWKPGAYFIFIETPGKKPITKRLIVIDNR
ncbi:MAG: MopE-related protein [Bacteroidota bacterium]